MASDVPLARESDLDWLLENLVKKVPHARSAVLLSADGLTRSACGLDADSADHLAAMACGLFSIVRSAGGRFGGGGGVRQVLAEFDDTLLFVYSAGSESGSVLAVLAGRQADPGVLGYEIAQLVKSVRPFLTTPARSIGAAAGGHVGQT